MSKDGVFYKQIQDIFQQIFENKNLVTQYRFGRTDFREVEYSLPDFNVYSEARRVQISFVPLNRGENLSERWERMHRHEYGVYVDRRPFGIIKRLPKREFIFFTKPYDSRERFIDNAIRSTLNQFDNVIESFEPGMAGEVR